MGEFLADPPEWWGRRAAECVRRGMPERPVNAPANATAFEVYGTSTRWSGETLPRVTERLEGVRTVKQT